MAVVKIDHWETAGRLMREAGTYERVERLAGVTDREKFWRKHPCESDGRAALLAMIADRLRKGELSADY